MAAAGLVAAGCGDASIGLPDRASDQADSIAGLWRGSLIAAAVVGALVWGLIIWAVVRYRRRDDVVPDQNPYNIPIEILYTVVPIIIVGVLLYFTVLTQNDVNELAEEPDLTIEVVGFQWQWQFTYPSEDIVVTGDATGDLPEMVLPVGQTVRFDLEAPDVIHSFWVPEFLYKRDLIPGVENEIDVDVTEAGTYTGRCAEFCGLDHYKMNFTVRAVPEAEFEVWVAEQQATEAATSP